MLTCPASAPVRQNAPAPTPTPTCICGPRHRRQPDSGKDRGDGQPPASRPKEPASGHVCLLSLYAFALVRLLGAVPNQSLIRILSIAYPWHSRVRYRCSCRMPDLASRSDGCCSVPRGRICLSRRGAPHGLAAVRTVMSPPIVTRVLSVIVIAV